RMFRRAFRAATGWGLCPQTPRIFSARRRRAGFVAGRHKIFASEDAGFDVIISGNLKTTFRKSEA
ncbi:MAG: hypothetical protein NXH84_08770, partial [Rhodobacteraceae bacterium]|nr:hypothetical protein [Paracoccaceae bacterium]